MRSNRDFRLLYEIFSLLNLTKELQYGIMRIKTKTKSECSHYTMLFHGTRLLRQKILSNEREEGKLANKEKKQWQT